jgi:pilus assembly protein TadC
VALFFIVYFAADYLYFKNNKSVLEAKGEYKKKYCAFQGLKTGIEKNERLKNIIEKKDEKLKKMGNPLKINGFTYYLYKLVILILFTILLLIGDMNGSLIFALAIAAFLPDFMINSLYKKEKFQILGDLPNINDVLNIQSGAAGMDLGSALVEVFDVAKCKRLKDKLIELSIEISLTKNIPDALDKFAQNFDITEIDSFVLALKQAITTGRSRELLDSQSELLKDASIARISAKTKEIGMWIGLVGIFIFLGLTSIILYSFGIQIFSSFKDIF